MPAVKAGSKALVTGANGFIAVWIVKTLLEKGYSVRAQVRSEGKGTHLKEIFGSHGDKLELVSVSDITEPGAFDSAVQNVDVILHTASPFHLSADDPAELIDPAVKGTTGILNSALKHGGERLQRVVVLSSTTAIGDGESSGYFDESVWNIANLKEIEEKGRNAEAASKYRASKTLAERAVWKFVEENKGKTKWDVVTLCPPLVLGPVIHEIKSPENLNTSTGLIFLVLIKSIIPPPFFYDESWVDVRDVAEAHVKALEVEKAGGERIIVSSNKFIKENLLKAWDAVVAKYPDLASMGPAKDAPTPAPGTGFSYNNTKSKTLLGLTYRDDTTVIVDTVSDYKAKGWI